MKRVFLFQRFVPNYRTAMYARVNEALGGGLVVCHGDPPAGAGLLGADGTAGFERVDLRNRWLGGERAVWQAWREPFRRFGRPDAVICEGNFRILSLLPLWAYCRAAGIPVAFWGHAGTARRDVVTSRDPRDVLYRRLIRAADAYICYTEGQREIVARIAPAERVFVARNTIDIDALAAIRERLDARGRAAVRAELGLTRDHYLCFIGRLAPDKLLDRLLDVVEVLRRRGRSVGAILVGGGPDRARLEARAGAGGDVVFTGPLPRWEESSPYLYASDVMVIPGMVGLAVNHAFALGLPVVTREQDENPPYHSPEIDYLQHGRTGFQVPGSSPEALADAVERVLADREAFSRRAIEYARAHLRPEHFAAGVRDAVEAMTAGR